MWTSEVVDVAVDVVVAATIGADVVVVVVMIDAVVVVVVVRRIGVVVVVVVVLVDVAVVEVDVVTKRMPVSMSMTLVHFLPCRELQ
jgi:hypothetical protein